VPARWDPAVAQRGRDGEVTLGSVFRQL